MLDLIDREFRTKSAPNILINQVIYPKLYNECSCLDCNVKDNDKK